MDLVIVSAAKFEVLPLLSYLEERDYKPRYISIGIGALNAAKNQVLAADAVKGKEVVFIGTCGCFNKFSGPELVRISEVHWLPTCERLGLAYTIKDTAPPFVLPRAASWARALPSKIALCSPTISLTSELPANLNPNDYVENVELYSCIAAIAKECSKLTVLLAITNAVGQASHQEWKMHWSQAAEMTKDFIISHRHKQS